MSESLDLSGLDEAVRNACRTMDRLRDKLRAREREVAELRKTLRSLRATFDTIHDRHYDNMDTIDGPDGQPKPNSDMHTVTDCTVALDEIERVEPKSPPAQGGSA